MFFDKYKDLFLNDNSDPYSRQMNRLKDNNQGQGTQLSQNLLSKNGARVFTKPVNQFSDDFPSTKLHGVKLPELHKFAHRDSKPSYMTKEERKPQNFAQLQRREERPRSNIYINSAEQMFAPQRRGYDQESSNNLKDAFHWKENERSSNLHPIVKRHNENSFVPRVDPLQKESSAFQDEEPHSNRQMGNDFTNRISYNFITGEDYNKKDPAQHPYINSSEGVMDMFSAFKNAKHDTAQVDKNPKEEEVERFQRNLADARKLLLPKEEAQNLQNIANQVFPAERFESFMKANINNPKRSKEFREAINRRIKSKLNINEKRDRLKQLLDRESRRRV